MCRPGFFKENVRDPVWICRDPISLILGTRFSLSLGTGRWIFLILGARFEILGTRIGSLKRLKKPWCIDTQPVKRFKRYKAYAIQSRPHGGLWWQVRNQLGTPGRVKSLPRGAQIF